MRHSSLTPPVYRETKSHVQIVAKLFKVHNSDAKHTKKEVSRLKSLKMVIGEWRTKLLRRVKSDGWLIVLRGLKALDQM